MEMVRTAGSEAGMLESAGQNRYRPREMRAMGIRTRTLILTSRAKRERTCPEETRATSREAMTGRPRSLIRANIPPRVRAKVKRPNNSELRKWVRRTA
ncbi:hypothetical protein ES703_102745 [subsurface metagenome]